MAMYEVIANNCSTVPSIKYSRKDLSHAMALFVASNLARGFRQVDVLNQDTGEVMLSNYVSEEFFKEDITTLDAIKTVETMFNN